jgi:hypothetical protein
MTRDLVRTGQRVLNVRQVRQDPTDRPPVQGRPAPVGPRTSFNGSLTRRRSRWPSPPSASTTSSG